MHAYHNHYSVIRCFIYIILLTTCHKWKWFHYFQHRTSTASEWSRFRPGRGRLPSPRQRWVSDTRSLLHKRLRTTRPTDSRRCRFASSQCCIEIGRLYRRLIERKDNNFNIILLCLAAEQILWRFEKRMVNCLVCLLTKREEQNVPQGLALVACMWQYHSW